MNRILTLLLVAAITCASYAVVIGDWEQSDDGWIDWGNGLLISDPNNMPSKYQYESSVGVTLGNYSLHVIQDGWGQSLAIKLQDNGLIDEFKANNTLSLDYSVKAGTSGGWNEIYAVYFNADGYGWHSIGGTPLFHYDFWDGSPERTTTITVDYSEVLDAIPENPSYVEIIFALNSGDGQVDFYFDNFQLTPEPATLVMLGLGSLALCRRRS